MNLPIIILSGVLILLIVVVIEATVILCRQKRNIAFQQNESEIFKEFRERLEDKLSQFHLNDEKLAEMVKNNAESVSSRLCEISSQLKALASDLNKQLERINPSYTTERLEGFCGQIMNRVISLEAKIYDLKRVNEQLVVDCRNQKNSPSATPSKVKAQTDKPSPENLKPPCKGKLIADLVKSLDPGENASPAETRKFEQQVKIINMIDGVLKISDIQAPPNFTLTLDTHWVKELGIKYEQVAKVDVMLLARLFNLDCDDIMWHMTNSLFPKTFEGKSIFWDYGWKRGDIYHEPRLAMVDDATYTITHGKDFWKDVTFDENIQAPDYTPCFLRVFNYCTQKDYFNRNK